MGIGEGFSKADYQKPVPDQVKLFTVRRWLLETAKDTVAKAYDEQLPLLGSEADEGEGESRL